MTDRVSAAEYRRQIPERDVLASCLAILEARRIPAWRANTGAVTKTNAAGRKRFIRFGTPGQADILAILPPRGRLLAIECKSQRGRVSADQEAFLQMVRDAGGLTVVVRDASELLAVLESAA